ncbi:MAG: LysR family transcriptional regulator [Verrucomicrobiota bacterium]
MNIHHLELFYYVARHGGIMEAVRHMPYGIQQPAISGQIIQLESDLGLKLFHRRPFELTPAGTQLFEFIRPFFGNVESIGEQLRGGVTQTIRLAAPAVILRDHLPAVLQEVRRRHPRLRLMLRDAHQPLVESWLERHEIDFAVTVLEGRPPSGIQSAPLVEVPAVFLVPRRGAPASGEALLEALAQGTAPGGDPARMPLPLISLPANEALPRLFRENLARRGLEWPVAIEVSSLDLIEIYAGDGFGVGLTLALPHRPVPRHLKALPVPGLPPLRIGALWRGRLTPLLQSLLETFQARARQFAQPSRPSPPPPA